MVCSIPGGRALLRPRSSVHVPSNPFDSAAHTEAEPKTSTCRTARRSANWDLIVHLGAPSTRATSCVPQLDREGPGERDFLGGVTRPGVARLVAQRARDLDFDRMMRRLTEKGKELPAPTGDDHIPADAHAAVVHRQPLAEDRELDYVRWRAGHVARLEQRGRTKRELERSVVGRAGCVDM